MLQCCSAPRWHCRCAQDGPLVAGDNGLPIHMDYLDNVEAAFQVR